MHSQLVPRGATPSRPSPRTSGSALPSAIALLLFFFSALAGFAQTQVGTLSVVNPTYMAIDTDASGTRWLYVSNHGDLGATNGGIVWKFNLTTGSTTGVALTTHGTGDGQFIMPDGIAVDPATHDLFVSDRYLDRIQRIKNDGTFVMKWGSSTAGAPDELHGPCGLALDSSGALYVTDHGYWDGDPSHIGQHVSKFTFSGSGSSTVVTRAWRIGSFGNGNGQFNSTGPYGIVVSGGQVYVADAFNYRIQVLNAADGSYASQFAIPGGAEPLGLSLDSSGALWIGETSNDSAGNFNGQGALQQVQKYSLSGTYAGVTVPGTPGSLSAFQGVIDPVTHRAYVSDYQNSRVVIFDLTSGGGTAPVVTNAAVSGTVGTAIANVQVSATNSPTSFSAAGLAPYGLSINSSGVISGTPTATATNAAIAVTATNASGTSAPATVTLNIAGATQPPTGPVVTEFTFVAHSNPPVFHIKFSEPVTGVSTNSFVFTQEGNSTGSFDSVTQDSPTDFTSYTLHFTFFTGAPGAFSFDLKTSGSDIVGTNSGLPYSGAGIRKAVVPVTPHLEVGQQFAPVVSSFAPDTPVGHTVNFVVTFNVPAFNIQPVNVHPQTTGSATATVGYIQPAPADNQSTVFIIPVTFSGSGTISLLLDDTTQSIWDGNYNYYVGPDTSTAFTIPSSIPPSTPYVNNAVVSGSVGTAITAVQVYATNSPTSFSAPDLASYGLAISSSGLITGAPTAAATDLKVNVTASNTAGTSNTATITLELSGAGGPPPPPPVPVVSNATVSGTVGTPISTVQVNATNSPTSFSAPGLATYGLAISNTGVISGTPTTAASGATVSVTASNSGGTSAAATITLNIAAAPPAGSPPVVSNATVSGTVGTAITPVTVSATNSPTSFSASGLASYGLSISNAGVISGTPTTAASGATVQVTATNANGSGSGTITLNIAAAPPAGSPPVVSNASVSGTVGTAITAVTVSATNSPTSFSAPGLATYGLSISSTGVITGTPTTAATGVTVSMTATNSAGTSAPATITLNIQAAPPLPPPPPPPPPPTPAPTVSSVTISATVGESVSYAVAATNNPDTFSISGQPAGITISNTGVISGTPTAAGTFASTVTATNAGGSGSGAITFKVLKKQHLVFVFPAGPVTVGQPIVLGATTDSGLPITYSVISGPATVSGNTLLITGTSAVVVRASAGGNTTYAPATADASISAKKAEQHIDTTPVPSVTHTDGKLTLAATSNSGLPITYSVVSGPATIDGNTLTFTGSGQVVIRMAQAGNGTYDATTSDVTITGNPVPRLINISTRAKVTAKDTDGATIAGFVVSGTAPKQILIRAVGPGLSAFNISAPLADPQLKLYDSKGALVATNSGWNDDAQIAAAGDGAGAFKLVKGSKDAAILATLQPGTYTAQVQSTSNSGTVLIEVYDVTANAAVPTKDLINISTRGVVGTGDDALFGGFVVGGNEPKKVLIRAVGPGLAQYNVTGLLTDPVLAVYDNKGAVIATNDNWSTQVAPATSADITAADTAVGAFPLVAGSTDSAIVLTLNPGAYTAKITGANNAQGNVLMEVYEVP